MFFIVCLYVFRLHGCMCSIWRQCLEKPEESIWCPGMGLVMLVSQHGGPGTWTPVLCTGSKSSWPLSYLSRQSLFFRSSSVSKTRAGTKAAWENVDLTERAVNEQRKPTGRWVQNVRFGTPWGSSFICPLNSASFYDKILNKIGSERTCSHVMTVCSKPTDNVTLNPGTWKAFSLNSGRREKIFCFVTFVQHSRSPS